MRCLDEARAGDLLEGAGRRDLWSARQQQVITPRTSDPVGESEDEGAHIPRVSGEEGASVKAVVGDRITVHGLHGGDAARCGEVIAVRGAGGEPPSVVCASTPPARRPTANPASCTRPGRW